MTAPLSLADNPLLNITDLVRFDLVEPQHITPAVDHLLAQNRELIAKLEQIEPTWENFIEPLERASERLARAWGVAGHLNGVVDTPELRAAYNENQPKLITFWTELGQNLRLFEQYKRIAASSEYASFNLARKKVIENSLRDFRLSGAELPETEKQRFAEIAEQHAATSTRFSENVLDATNDYKLDVTDLALLDGIPPDALQAAGAAAKAAGIEGYRFTLHFPSYFPLLQFCKNRELRATMYQAYVTRASDQGQMFSQPEQWDNTELIKTLLQLRQEEAKLLGYRNYAEVSLVPKMAQSPEQVIEFLNDLARRARPFAEQDLAELRAFAAAELKLPELAAWDISFASEKLREQRYAFSQQELKQYFPAPRVLAGLFELIQKLYRVQISQEPACTWHPDVQFFRIERNGQLLGQFYLDSYARTGKRSGAWMSGARSRARQRADAVAQTPIAYLICNFTPPLGDKPSLLTHADVTTLFHEFGHGLHHMLTRVDEINVAGIHGVEWDAVELPSQFMENFCWQWDVLQGMSGHVETGAALPRELFDKMLAAKNYQSGLMMLRQVEMSLVDMLLHHDFDLARESVQDLIGRVRHEVSLLPPPAFNRFQNAFTHIFAGGYAAGYYSYKWAEVLSSDAYGAFEESDDVTTTGERFEREILAVGGSRPAMASFVAFRGREPQIDALLRHNGMTAQAT